MSLQPQTPSYDWTRSIILKTIYIHSKERKQGSLVFLRSAFNREGFPKTGVMIWSELVSESHDHLLSFVTKREGNPRQVAIGFSEDPGVVKVSAWFTSVAIPLEKDIVFCSVCSAPKRGAGLGSRLHGATTVQKPWKFLPKLS